MRRLVAVRRRLAVRPLAFVAAEWQLPRQRAGPRFATETPFRTSGFFHDMDRPRGVVIAIMIAIILAITVSIGAKMAAEP